MIVTPHASSHSRSLIDYDILSSHKLGESVYKLYHIIIFYIISYHISHVYICMIVPPNTSSHSRSLIDYDILSDESGYELYRIIIFYIISYHISYIYIYDCNTKCIIT